MDTCQRSSGDETGRVPKRGLRLWSPGSWSAGSSARTRFSPPRRAAFTLIEVMIAGGILFMCLFAILALVANSLRSARLIQSMKDDPTASVAAMVSYIYSSTNGTIGPLSGEFLGWSYEAESTFITNGLYLVDLYLPAQGDGPESRMQFYIFNGKQTRPLAPGMKAVQ